MDVIRARINNPLADSKIGQKYRMNITIKPPLKKNAMTFDKNERLFVCLIYTLWKTWNIWMLLVGHDQCLLASSGSQFLFAACFFCLVDRQVSTFLPVSVWQNKPGYCCLETSSADVTDSFVRCWQHSPAQKVHRSGEQQNSTGWDYFENHKYV